MDQLVQTVMNQLIQTTGDLCDDLDHEMELVEERSQDLQDQLNQAHTTLEVLSLAKYQMTIARNALITARRTDPRQQEATDG